MADSELFSQRDADEVTAITPLVRRFSLKTEREKPDETLSRALGSAVRELDEKESKTSRGFQQWQMWLQNGSLDW